MKKLIIALDNMSKDDVVNLITEISTKIDSGQIVYKLNDLLAFAWFEWLNELFSDSKAFFMLDPKYHDIENTCKNYLKKLNDSWFSDKIEFLTLHSSLWEKALKNIVSYRDELWLSHIKLLGITVLTSFDENDSYSVYNLDSKDIVLRFANIARKSWLDWVVCSAYESAMIKEVFWKDFITMTPGIRLDISWNTDDQKRIVTPSKAIENWSDNIVVWRPITLAEDKISVVNSILSNINSSSYLWEAWKYKLDKYLVNRDWDNILKYIWVIYIRPENGKYCRLASWLLSNAYINIGVLERYPKILQVISSQLREKLIEKWIFDLAKKEDFVLLWAQMWSVRISSHLALALWLEWTSIYTEKDWDDMKLKRHDIDLRGKKVIISEDIISKGSTLKKMIKLVKNAWWEVVWITCVWNRYWKDEFDWVPLLSCYIPAKFELYHDSETPEENIWDSKKLPENAMISKKPKNDWNGLVKSMLDNKNWI